MNYIFIISHMRSYSTLLSHVLGSNKNIDGYGELHYSYLNRFDSLKAKIQVMYAVDNSLQGNFILDKLLHNANQIAESFLQKNTVKLIFLLRNPIDTYKSRINLLQRIKKRNIDPLQIHNYYINRLPMLVQQAKSLDTKKIFIESEQIKTNTSATLQKLNNFLELDDKLTNNYQLFKFSGYGNYGDSTDNIKIGVISKGSNQYDNIVLPDEIMKIAHIVYNESKLKLMQLCNN
ncbi:hypothetical protein ACFL0J_00650 [Candidatus Neomarinimicrobiota bacterium]